MRQTKYGRIRLFLNAMGIIAVTLTACAGSEERLVTDTQISGIAELSTIADYGGGDTGTQFAEGVIVGTVANNALDEVSGCAASQVNTNTFWVHNDSGDSARFYAIGRDGSDLGTFNISGGFAQDYEDIAVGPGPIAGRSYVYVGDFGDNFAIRGSKTIYRMLEPQIGSSGSTVSADVINIIYPDGSRDAETLMVDPVNADVYVVGKRDSSNRVYLFAAPLQDGQTYTGVEVARIDISGLVGGDISSDGSRILIKTASSMYLWLRGQNETVGEALSRTPVSTPYTQELQGEAVCWSPDGVGYYTTSEGGNQPLYYFRGLDSANTGGGGGTGGSGGSGGISGIEGSGVHI